MRNSRSLSDVVFSLLIATGCASLGPYDRGAFIDSPKLRHSGIPLASGTKFKVKQGAFGHSSHREPGNEFAWDLEIPWGTPILAVEDGTVFYSYQPANAGGGCDSKFSNDAWNVLIQNIDGSVAQYTHVEGLVRTGEKVKKGQVIGHNVPRGWVCYPHVHYSIYRSRDTLYQSPNRETLPIYFDGIPGGILKESGTFIVP